MPRDTPPPISKEILDEWYAKRRAKRNANQEQRNANQEPIKEREGRGRQHSEKPAAPVAESRTVYEAKPIIRDLVKEAVSAFVPTTVRMKIEKGKGQGGLLEPEEADQLEKEGYLRAPETARPQSEPMQVDQDAPRKVTLEEVEDEED